MAAVTAARQKLKRHSGLDPHVIGGSNASRIVRALFESLITIANDGVTLLPATAERWEISPDRKTYTFHLRANARWSNGDPVTAQDFLGSFQRVLEPKLAGPYSAYALQVAGAREYVAGQRDFNHVALHAPDPQTLVITTTDRTPYFLARLGQVPFYPVHLLSVDRAGGGRSAMPRGRSRGSS